MLRHLPLNTVKISVIPAYTQLENAMSTSTSVMSLILVRKALSGLREVV